MTVVAAIVILGIYLTCPIVGKIALLLANSVLPDPIPFVDEFIMWIGLFAHLSRLLRVAEFIRDHKRVLTLALVAVILMLLLILL